MEDDYKPLFQDAMNGFQAYAKLKGYKITFATDVTLPGKVGIKIIVRESQDDISVDSVRHDVEEYIQKLEEGNDFRDMPIVTNPIEHQQIVAALKMRFSFLKHEIELHAAAAEAYRNILSTVGDFARASDRAPMNQNITFHVEGTKLTHEANKIAHSPGVITGKDIAIERSTIGTGTTPEQYGQQLKAITELVIQLQASGLAPDEKGTAVRDLENLKEEITDSIKPDQDRIGKWLGRVRTIIQTTTAGAELIEKTQHVFRLFGLKF